MSLTGSNFSRLFAALLCCSMVGCLSPMTTRLPTFVNGDPRREGRAFEFHDPLPDPNIGPDLGIRPPDFNLPRTRARQGAEQRILFGLPFAPEAMPAGNRQGGLARPNAL